MRIRFALRAQTEQNPTSEIIDRNTIVSCVISCRQNAHSCQYCPRDAGATQQCHQTRAKHSADCEGQWLVEARCPLVAPADRHLHTCTRVISDHRQCSVSSDAPYKLVWAARPRGWRAKAGSTQRSSTHLVALHAATGLSMAPHPVARCLSQAILRLLRSTGHDHER